MLGEKTPQPDDTRSMVHGSTKLESEVRLSFGTTVDKEWKEEESCTCLSGR